MSTLVDGLIGLRNEFNTIAPLRDKGSDGWIGDTAHQHTTSDHNPDANGYVHAIDIDSTGPWPLPFAQLMAYLIGRARSGTETRIHYLIWDRHIYRSETQYTKEPYVATSDPHIGHGHISAFHNSTAFRTTGWGLVNYVNNILNPPKAVTPMDPKNAQLIEDLMEFGIGRSKNPTVGVALQSGYSNGVSALQMLTDMAADIADIKTVLLRLTPPA